MRICIVKTSSLGDIIQAFDVLNVLRRHFPQATIDWAVEERWKSIVAAHPLVNEAVALDLKGRKWWSALQKLRRKTYDLIFDLQGNCKSGVVTWFARGGTKVGFGMRSVREWPNVFATQVRIDVPKGLNIRLQHMQLVQQFLGDATAPQVGGVRFRIEEREQEVLRSLLQRPELQRPLRVMVCPGAKWANKQVPLETMCQFLEKIARQFHASFLLMWGALAERDVCEKIHTRFLDRSLVVDTLPIPTWQNLMNEVDLVLAVDSSALHLCGTTKTPSFSLFGPTSPEVFKPIGPAHFALRGTCPYHRSFTKTCPVLRSCPTGACIRSFTAEAMFAAFSQWWSAR